MYKFTIKHALIFIVLTTSFLLNGSVFAAYIDLIVTGAGVDTKLEIADSDVKCHGDKHCIKTEKGKELDVDFKLKGACRDGGPAYRLSGMQFSMIQRQPKSDGSSDMVKAFGRYDIPSIVVSDFDTEVNGIVKWGGQNDLKDDKIKIKDKNDGEYVVFFQIEASKCPDSGVAGPDVIYLDPRVKNTGN